MVFRCSVEGYNHEGKNVRSITLVRKPFEDDQRSGAKERRQRSVNFCGYELAKSVWRPSKSDRVCSVHFLESDLERRSIRDLNRPYTLFTRSVYMSWTLTECHGKTISIWPGVKII